MPKANVQTDRPHNQILLALPEDDYEQLALRLERVSLDVQQSLYRPKEPIEWVYFVLNGVVSIVALESDQNGIEVATIGNEGLVGVPVFLGVNVTPMHGFVQIPGEALRLTAPEFRQALDQIPALRDLCSRYVQGLFTQISQSAACNRLHTIEERTARWLLMSHDRVEGDEFLLTQKFLGQMLGVRRGSVNLIAGVFQKAGYIRYVRGRITILDRAGLEAVTCECYHIIRQEFETLLGPSA